MEEHGQPRYITGLIGRDTVLSIETMRLVDSLPGLDSRRSLGTQGARKGNAGIL